MQFWQIVNAALADAAMRSGEWLACRPGCNQCCTGVFRISPLDGERLREGLRRLGDADHVRAQHLRERVRHSVTRLSTGFPGDPRTGLLYENDVAREAFEEFADDEVCPVLDPETGTCDLYAFRPMTCRTFGPPVQTEDGLGMCELCFNGAPPDTIKAAEMHLPPPEMESSLAGEIGLQGETIVTFALVASAGTTW